MLLTSVTLLLYLAPRFIHMQFLPSACTRTYYAYMHYAAVRLRRRAPQGLRALDLLTGIHHDYVLLPPEQYFPGVLTPPASAVTHARRHHTHCVHTRRSPALRTLTGTS